MGLQEEFSVVRDDDKDWRPLSPPSSLLLTSIGGQEYPLLVKGGIDYELNGSDRCVVRKRKSLSSVLCVYILTLYLIEGIVFPSLLREGEDGKIFF